MKVIALTSKEHKPNYVCEIQHDELEKFMDLYYGKLSELKPGDEIDLRKSYELESRIVDAVKKMEMLVEASTEITKAVKEARIIKKKIEKRE